MGTANKVGTGPPVSVPESPRPTPKKAVDEDGLKAEPECQREAPTPTPEGPGNEQPGRDRLAEARKEGDCLTDRPDAPEA